MPALPTRVGLRLGLVQYSESCLTFEAGKVSNMDTDERLTVLTVDVANRLTRLGLFVGDELLSTWETSTPAHLTTDEARAQVATFLVRNQLHAPDFGRERAQVAYHAEGGQEGPHGTVLSCVVPSHSGSWAKALGEAARIRALVVGPGIKTGVRMRLESPGEVGADRVANVMAARALLGSPAVVVSLGTTTNIEVVDASGSFVGGTIAPGLMMSLRSLNEVAARLPLVELRVPHRPIGRNTREAVQAGVVLGEVARVDGLLDYIMEQLGQDAPVVMTGHHAAVVSPLLRHDASVDETLTLRGLKLIWDANQRS